MPKRQSKWAGAFFGGGTALLLPEQCIEVGCLAQDSTLPNVKILGQSFEMQHTACQFKVGVGDGTGGVLSGDELVNDVLGPLQSPYNGLTFESFPWH